MTKEQTRRAELPHANLALLKLTEDASAIAELQRVCADAQLSPHEVRAFLNRCARIRRRLIEAAPLMPVRESMRHDDPALLRRRRPSFLTNRYLRMADKWAGVRRRGRKPRYSLDVLPFDRVNLALVDPDLRVDEEPIPSARAAAAFRALAARPIATASPDVPAHHAAMQVRILLEEFDIRFTRYASESNRSTTKRAFAARVLRAVLGPLSPEDVAPLLKSTDEARKAPELAP